MKLFQIITLSALIAATSSCKGGDNPAADTKTAQTTDCRIDPVRIHSWEEFEDLEGRPSPFSEVYTGCNKTLVYVAAQHGNDPDSETFNLIRKRFGEYDFDFAVLEGFPSDLGRNPERMIAQSLRAKGTARDAEPLFTIRQIMDKGAAFTGGEPTDKQVVDEAVKAGISPVDTLGYYIVRQIPQFIRGGDMSDANDPRLGPLISNRVKSFSDATGVPREELQAVDGLDAFYAWYSATNGVNYKENFRDEDHWPGGKFLDKARKTNQISTVVADARDSHIVGIIDEALRDHDTVLVVYGASHFTIQEPAFQAAFGKNADGNK